MKKLSQAEGSSADIVTENIEEMKKIFPDVFSENGVNFDVLRQLLSDAKVLDEGEEKYGLNWHGKKKARQIALTPSTGTLRPCHDDSVDWDKTQNLFIEGDNLEVLKLLQKSYANKVKMIYIDPPYNTGKEFVYPDNYQDNLDTYLRYTGQKGEDGLKFTSNTESSGRKHTNWLNMMYPRLKLAKNLLRQDGVIFISIDDNEQANLKKICDEIFGEDNFVAQFLWKKKSTTSNVKDAQVSPQVDYQICYKKSDAAKIKQRVKHAETRAYPEKDETGNYRTEVIEKKDSGSYKRDTMKFAILGHLPRKGKRWQIGEETAKELVSKNRLYFDGEKIKLKIYDFEDENTFSAQPNVLENCGNSESAAEMVNSSIMGHPELFDNPKPYELIKHFLNISVETDGVVLDFFSGSATTAHSVMQFNTEGGRTCKFIMVQLPEICTEDSEAFKAGYKTIADIGKERIRRTAKKIQDENPDYQGDLGFKVFKLDSSNIRAWNPDAADLEKTLLDNAEHLVAGRSDEDVLYELLLKRGVDLTVPIESRKIAGKLVYSIGHGVLFACLATTIKRDEVEDIASGIVSWFEKLKPATETHVFFRDSAFADDVTKTNLSAILGQHGITHVRSL